MTQQSAIGTVIVTVTLSAMFASCVATKAPESTALFDQVEGLSYRSSSGLEGETNQDGEFTFAEGDQVSFAISDLVLGSVEMTTGSAPPRVTPAHLAPDVGGNIEGIDDQRVTNIARLLQSLDADKNIENGVTITQEIAAAASRHAGIDFDQSEQAFEADPHVVALTDEVGATLRTPAQARNQLRRTLRGIRKMSDVQIPTRDPGVQGTRGSCGCP